ncbi:MAG: hypothetical protein L0312_04120, partial [Acidobacteria bacterium]|nr:hypothetical protein [Acidobacteriota bacterium]
ASLLEKARNELQVVQGEIIRTKALAEVELRLQTERHTKSLAVEYQRVMESAITAKKEADHYAATTRAAADEADKADRKRRTDEVRAHAMRMTELGKQKRETMKANAIEAAQLRGELERLAADKAGELEARFAKAQKFLAGIEQGLKAVSEQVLGLSKPVYIPDNKNEVRVQ